MEEYIKQAMFLIGTGFLTLAGYIFKGVLSQLKELKLTQQGLVRQSIVVESDIMGIKDKVTKNIDNILNHEARLDDHELKLAEIKTVHNASNCATIKLS